MTTATWIIIGRSSICSGQLGDSRGAGHAAVLRPGLLADSDASSRQAELRVFDGERPHKGGRGGRPRARRARRAASPGASTGGRSACAACRPGRQRLWLRHERLQELARLHVLPITLLLSGRLLLWLSSPIVPVPFAAAALTMASRPRRAERPWVTGCPRRF